MHPDETPELDRLAAQLAALAPRGELDRDRLMFAAGKRAAHGRLTRINRLLAAGCVLLAATTVATLVVGDREGEIPREKWEVAASGSAVSGSHASAETAGGKTLRAQLVVADGRELATAVAEGRGELTLSRSRDSAQEPGDTAFERSAARVQPKSARKLLLEFLESTDGPLYRVN